MSASKLRGLVAAGKKKEFVKHYSDPKLGAKIHDQVKAGLQMESTSPVGIFLLGGPGSGKDYVLKNIFSRFDLTEVQADQILSGGIDNLIRENRNFVINGALDERKIGTIKTMLEGYDFDHVYVAVTNKVSRVRNSLRESPLVEHKRIEKFLSAEKLAEKYDCFRFNNSINLNESSEFERVFFASQIEKLLERVIGLGLVMTEDHDAHLKPVHTVQAIAAKHKVSEAIIIQALAVGKKVEMEHTNDEHTAETIALAHLAENPDYYTNLAKVEQYTASSQMAAANYTGTANSKKLERSREVHHFRDVHRREREAHKIATQKEEVVNEDLRQWFNQKWVRMDTKGEIKGDCAREDGEGKPKCLPLAKARSMDKDDRAAAAKRKRREDPVADRRGKGNAPINVATEAVSAAQQAAIAVNMKKKGIKPKNEEVESLQEKNVPTNPELWSKAKSLAKSKFDVYPSAYANGWASKWYKSKGGGWKSVSEEVELDEMQLVGTDSYRKHAIAMTPGQSQDIANAYEGNKEISAKDHEEDCGCEGDCGCDEETEHGNAGSGNIREAAAEKVSTADLTPTLSTKKKPTGDKRITGYNARQAGLSVVSNLSVSEDVQAGRSILAKMKTIKLQTEEQNLQTAIQHHLNEGISFTKNEFRPGSEMFFEMINEAKRLYKEGKYTPEDEYEQDLLESDIGEIVEYNGELVVLDFPYDETLDEACWKGYTQKGMKKKGDRMVPNCVPVNEEDETGGHGIGKPWREGGGGAVYVRSGGSIKKVRFSQSGMAKKYKDPARVRSFVARHHCLTNKDRTSASYWACRWPRYFSDSGQTWW